MHCEMRMLTTSRLDLLHALYFKNTPLYTTSDTSSVQGTPALGALHVPELDQETLDELSDYLVNMPNVTSEELLDPTLPIVPSVTPTTFQSSTRKWHERMMQEAQAIDTISDGTLEHACSLAGSLHLATTSPVRPNRVKLQTQTEELFTAMTSLPNDAWDAFHVLHIRV
jgi:hypothetical protein